MIVGTKKRGHFILDKATTVSVFFFVFFFSKKQDQVYIKKMLILKRHHQNVKTSSTYRWCKNGTIRDWEECSLHNKAEHCLKWHWCPSVKWILHFMCFFSCQPTIIDTIASVTAHQQDQRTLLLDHRRFVLYHLIIQDIFQALLDR